MPEIKKGKVLSTSLRLFTAQGLQRTSMAQISKESGVAVGTMYLYFKSKDEIIEAVYMNVKEQLAEAVRLNDLERQMSLKTRFEITFRKGYDYFITHRDEFLFSFTHSYSPHISNELRQQERAEFQDAIKIVTEGKDTGIFRNLPDLFLWKYIYNNIVSLVQMQIAQEVELTPELISETTQMAWSGLLLGK